MKKIGLVAALIIVFFSVNLAIAQTKGDPVPGYMKGLAKALKCQKMKDCQNTISEMIKKDLTKFLSLVDKNVDLKKTPQSFKDLIKKLKSSLEKIKQAAKEKSKEKSKEEVKKNPCPLIKEVQFEPIPALPEATKACFGANGTSTIDGQQIKLLLFLKQSLKLPQYAFKKSVNCPAGQVTAVKADASGIECVNPGTSKFEFTYNFCPKGFMMIPRPEEADGPKFCFGFLNNIGAYVIWPYNVASSTYAAIPESEFGVNQKCDYTNNILRSMDKEVKTIQCKHKDLLFDIDNPNENKKVIEGYKLPNRYSIVFPIPNLDGQLASPPHPDQGSAAVTCFQGTYATSTFYKARVQICRLFK